MALCVSATRPRPCKRMRWSTGRPSAQSHAHCAWRHLEGALSLPERVRPRRAGFGVTGGIEGKCGASEAPFVLQKPKVHWPARYAGYNTRVQTRALQTKIAGARSCVTKNEHAGTPQRPGWPCGATGRRPAARSGFSARPTCHGIPHIRQSAPRGHRPGAHRRRT